MMEMGSIVSSLPVGGLSDGAGLPGQPITRAEVEHAGTQFESVFISMLLKEMRNTLSEGLFSGDNSDVYGGMFDTYLGQSMSEGGNLGIKQMVLEAYEQRERQPKFAQPPAASINITA